MGRLQSAVCISQVAGVRAIYCISAGRLVLLWGWNAAVCIVMALQRASNFPHVDMRQVVP